MADDKETERWAQDFIDFWQDQVSALASDPAAAAALLPPLSTDPLSTDPLSAGSFSAGPFSAAQDLAAAPQAALLQAWLTALGGAASGIGTAEGPDTASGHDGDTQRAAPPGAPSAGGGGELERLARRLDALEERLAALEDGAESTRRTTPRRPADDRAGKPGSGD